MKFTKERIESEVPEVYRDFMLALRRVIDSRKDVFQITGIPLRSVFEFVSSKYGYDPFQVNEVANNLIDEGLITKDRFGFFAPTVKGEKFIRALAPEDDPAAAIVPPLPKL